MKIFVFSITFFIVYLGAFPLIAQEKKDTLTYSRQEVMIPMRDGIKLFTVIFTPKNVKNLYHFFLQNSLWSQMENHSQIKRIDQ